MVRNSTLEDKILLVKTFGLSQLIYNMLCYKLKEKELINTDRLIFKPGTLGDRSKPMTI
jgi:hypothetical protein